MASRQFEEGRSSEEGLPERRQVSFADKKSSIHVSTTSGGQQILEQLRRKRAKARRKGVTWKNGSSRVLSFWKNVLISSRL